MNLSPQPAVCRATHGVFTLSRPVAQPRRRIDTRDGLVSITARAWNLVERKPALS